MAVDYLSLRALVRRVGLPERVAHAAEDTVERVPNELPLADPTVRRGELLEAGESIDAVARFLLASAVRVRSRIDVDAYERSAERASEGDESPRKLQGEVYGTGRAGVAGGP